MTASADEDVVAKIKSRVNLLEVVQSHVRLRKQGREWVGLCPFHEEKTPSFQVNEQKQSWYCFGCQAHGDLFTFVEMIEKTDFKGALERLADVAGVELKQESGTGRRISKERQEVIELLELARRYYSHVLLTMPAGEPGRALLLKRGVDEETALEFGLGFAPSGNNLATYLTRRNQPLAVARVAGLVRRDGQDYFQERLVIPIRNERGQVVAFTGRTLKVDEPRKYINSPESPAYVKGRVLFGLDLARRSIEEKGHAVLMEGQFDVIAAHRHGVGNAVASSGTALTEDQIRLLQRFTDELLLVFDADPAGRKAAFHAIELASGRGLRTRVGVLPGAAKDPDEFLREGGDWEGVGKAAQPGWEFWIRDVIAGLNPSSPADFEVALRNVNQVLARITDPAVREVYRRDAALWLGIDDRLLVLRPGHPGKVAAGGPSGADPEPALRTQVRPAPSRLSKRMEYLIQVLAVRPDAAARVRDLLDPAQLDADDRVAYEAILAALEAGGVAELERDLSALDPQLAGLVRRSWADPPPGLDDATVDDVARQVALSAGRGRRFVIIRQLAEAETTGDATRTSALELELRQLLDRER